MKSQRQTGARTGIVFLAGWLLLLCPAGLFAETVYVSTNSALDGPGTAWSNAFHTIQAAVDTARAGDVVLVTNGVYSAGGAPASGGSLTNRVMVDEAIEVRSVNGPDVTEIRGGGSLGSTGIRCVYLDSGTLRGFTLANGHTRLTGGTAEERGGGVYCANGAEIRDCVIAGCDAVGGGGVSGGTLVRCILRDNTATWDGGNAIAATLRHCLLVGGEADYGGGARYSDLFNCTVTGNSAREGGGCDECTLKNSIVYGNSASQAGSNHHECSDVDYTCTMPSVSGSGNITNSPRFLDAGAENYSLAADSPCIERGNDKLLPGGTDLAGRPCPLDGDADGRLQADMGAYEFARVLYVWTNSPSPETPYLTWSQAAHTLQAAVDAAWTGSTVIATNGEYSAGGTPRPGHSLSNRVCITLPITVRSVNGRDVTTISGAGPSGPGAVRCAYVGTNAVLQGFTLTDGHTTTNGVDTLDYRGGGACCAPSAIVRDCALVGNRASQEGGGSYEGRVLDCLFANNHAMYGGGAYAGTLVRCSVSNNTASAGGGTLGSTLSNAVVVGNTATNGWGGGTFGGRLYNCLVSDNTGISGGGAGRGELYNCILTGNTASDRGGGAILANLHNCTLAGNSTANEGGGSHGGSAKNCIIYYNDAAAGSNTHWTTTDHSCTTPDPGGAGNVTGMPQFADAAGGDYRLLQTSPCLNAGTNQPWMITATDVGGLSRIRYGVVDMGAHECAGLVHYVALAGAHSPPFQTWANAATDIHAAVELSLDGDEVRVTNDTFILNSPIWLTNGVALRSEQDAASTIIDGNTNTRCVILLHSNAVLDGFTVRNGFYNDSAGPYYGGGIYCAGGARVRSCIISNNFCSDLGGNNQEAAGGVMFGPGGGLLEDCTVGNNHGKKGGGVHTRPGAVVRNCRIERNGGYQGGGLYMNTGGRVRNSLIAHNFTAAEGGGVYQLGTASVLQSCTVVDNEALNLSHRGGGIYCASGTVHNTIIWSNWWDVSPEDVYVAGDATIAYSCSSLGCSAYGPSNCTDAPLFADFAGGDFRLLPESPCLNTGTNQAWMTGAQDLDGDYPRIMQTTVDRGAFEWYPLVHYVAKSGGHVWPYETWEHAATNIQPAVYASRDGHSVIVTDGVYRTGTHRAPGELIDNRVLVTNAVGLRSVNGPDAVSIVGKEGPGPIRCVYLADGALLDGFTLTEGDTRNSGYPGGYGGGVYATGPGAVVSNCVFVACRGAHGAGGVGATFYDCRFTHNTAGHGGGGVCSGMVYNSTLAHNAATEGGGAYGSDLESCVVVSNRAEQKGGGAFTGKLVNCLVAYNLATNQLGRGGGAWDSPMDHCTVVYNRADDIGGVGGWGVVRNCILYYNENEAGDVSNWGKVTFGTLVFHACTVPVFGNSSFTNAPEFVDAAGGDFHLTEGSPCADAGTNLPAVLRDLDGIPRPLDGDLDGSNQWDVGCYELAHSEGDSDGDSMTDLWETHHALDPLDPADALIDADGDATLNLHEWMGDTGPHDRDSHFRLTHVSRTNALAIGFTCTNTRHYSLQWRPSLAAGDWQGAAGCTGVTGEADGHMTLCQSNTVPAALYRVRVRVP